MMMIITAELPTALTMQQSLFEMLFLYSSKDMVLMTND